MEEVENRRFMMRYSPGGILYIITFQTLKWFAEKYE